MQFSTLEVMGITREHLVQQPIEILGFGGGTSLTIGYNNFDLGVGSIQAATCIHIIYAYTPTICYWEAMDS